MSMLDMLLGNSDKITARPEEEFEVSRLSELCGEPFLMKAHALTMRELDGLPIQNHKEHVIIKAITEPDFTSGELARRLTPKDRKTPFTPIEVVDTLFLPGEIVNLYNMVMELSGYGQDAVAKIKKN